MNVDDAELSRSEHDEIRDLLLAGTQSISPARPLGGTQLAAAGVALLLVGGAGGFVASTLLERDGGVTATPAPRTTAWSGWTAFASGSPDSDIYLVKQGAPARRLLATDADDAHQICPAFSPDGTRLVSGQTTGSEATGDLAAALVITDVSPAGEPSGTTTIALDDVVNPPCAIWSADGRWLAYGAQTGANADVNEVRVVDTETHGVRRVTGALVSDLEWSPIASELIIARNGILVYSTTDDETRRVDGTSGAVAVTISPDGEFMVVQHDPVLGTSVADNDLLLMRTDGSEQRTLVADYGVGHGIGPVWSPDGKRVAFQRECATYVDASGREQACLDEHDVVVVTVSDDDPLGPFGTTTVIPPPRTADAGQTRVWAPYSVSWSPDSETLLYLAWNSAGDGILAVPVDGATQPVVLQDTLKVGGHVGELWNTFQSWSTRRV